MALSGTISGTYKGWTVESRWSATQSTSGNYSDITVEHYLVMASGYNLGISSRTNTCTVNGVAQDFTSGSISGGGTKYLGTTSYRVGHNSDGTKSCSLSTDFNVKATLSGTYVAKITASGTITLDTIPRGATITSAPDFNDTQNPTIQYSNPAGSAVSSLQACISLTGSNDDIAYRDIPISGTSYTFNLTTAERNVLRAAAANSNTLSVKFMIRTVLSGTDLYSTVQKTMTIVNANPTFTAAYEDTNSAVVAVTGNNQLIVQNKSTLAVKITNATALKSASLRTATCVLNGTTYSGNISSSSYTFNIGTLDISSNATATVTVTDSRGNSTTQTLTIQMIAYYAPSAIITSERENNYYSTTTVNVDASYASVNGANSVTIKVRYKKTTDSTWSSYVTFQDNVPQNLTLDNNYAWDLQTVITDLYSTVTYNKVVSRGMPIVYFDRLKSATGFNCFPQNDEGVELSGWDLLFHDGDTYTFNNSWMILAGIVTGSKQALAFSLPLPKIAQGLNVSITTLKINVRHSDGGFTLTNNSVDGGYNVLTDNTLSVSVALINPTMLGIRIAKSSGQFNGTNNSPQAIQVGEITLSFSAAT